jgi:hypothetical protein
MKLVVKRYGKSNALETLEDVLGELPFAAVCDGSGFITPLEDIEASSPLDSRLYDGCEVWDKGERYNSNTIGRLVRVKV